MQFNNLTKQQCRELAPSGWDYVGLDGDYIIFSTGNYRTGFKEMCLLPEDMETKNLQYMIDHGLTRDIKFKH